MAYTGIIATEPELDAMAGENVDLTGWTEANKNAWMKQVEGHLSSHVKYDIATNWATLDAVGKGVLSEYAARYCAVSGVTYNPSGFSSLIEAEDIMQVHIYRMDLIEKQLADTRVAKFLGAIA